MTLYFQKQQKFPVKIKLEKAMFFKISGNLNFGYS